MSIHPLPPAKPPTGVGRVPIARWFVFAGAATAVAFLAGVVLIMMMITRVRELDPKPEVAAQINRLNVALVVLFVVILLAGVALAFIVRFTVLDPIARLTEQVRTVAGGDFDHRLGVERPAELAELSSHIDSMRRRILFGWRTASDQADELRRSNSELEQFAYVASHDLQEPLRKVASFTQMLEQRYENELDDRAKQYIHFAVDGAKRMQLLINDLLDFSRVGRMGGEKEPMDSGEAVAAALENLSAAIEDADATVTTGELPRVVGSRTQLTQLFQNLIENAVKFRGEEPPRVRIEAVRRDDMWEFSCADNGIGIEPRYADRIFLIFQRLHPRDVYAGTGIGLALCRKIVDYHGGRLWLGGEAGAAGEAGKSGTTFRWTLPAAD